MHKNKINNKLYIGQTKYNQNPNKRWRNGEGYKRCTHFYNAIQKYGWDNFEHEILYDNLTLEEANQLEEKLIAEYDTMNPDKGYNLKSGGENNLLSEKSKRKISEAFKGENHPLWNKHHSEETKKKISKAHKGKKIKPFTKEHKEKIRNALKGKSFSEEHKENLRKNHANFKGKNHPKFGKHLSDETKRKIGEKNKGKILSEETRQKISEKLKGENHPLYGKHHSEETRNKISESNKGKNITEEHKNKIIEANRKQIYCIDLDKIFNSITEASKELEIDASSITRCCQGKYKQIKGYHFKYMKEKE